MKTPKTSKTARTTETARTAKTARTTRKARLVIGVFALVATSFATSAAVRGDGPTLVSKDFEKYVHYLNELSARRQSSTLFPNPQTPTYGSQLGLVNVGRGNLTFLRKDLVTAGRVPLAAARVYDSSAAGSGDFGPGWSLTLAEVVVIEGQTVRRVDFSGSTHGESISTGVFESTGRLVLRGETGLVKTFRRARGNRFVLETVADAYGNWIELVYGPRGRISHATSSNGRSLVFARDARGRIVRASDDRSRSVRYDYDEAGRLIRASDLGGQVWTYRYDRADRLIAVDPPLGAPELTVVYDDSGRVGQRTVRGQRWSYRYSARRTTVEGREGQSYVFTQNERGITIAVRNPLGLESRLVLDGDRPTGLLYDDRTMARFGYDAAGRLIAVRSPGGETPSLAFRYDEHDRLVGAWDLGPDARIGARRLTVDYRDDSTAVQRVWTPDSSFGLSTRGDLEYAAPRAGVLYRMRYNDDGHPIEVATREQRYTFRYDEDGRLSTVSNRESGLHQRYVYDALGVRVGSEFDDGGKIRYRYNAAGSVVEIDSQRPDGVVRTMRIVLDDHQRAVEADYSGGGAFRYQYDDMGNLIVASADDKTIRYAYDDVGRLTRVEVDDGTTHGYSYDDGEPDLRALLIDERRAFNRSRCGPFVDYTGPLGAHHHGFAAGCLGTVYFDEDAGAFRVSEPAVALPLHGFLEVGRFERLIDSERRYSRDFELPSNKLFHPAEFRSLNCCIDCFSLVCCDRDGCEYCGPPLFEPCQFTLQVTSSQAFNVTTTPAMPTINAVASGNPPGTTINWTAEVRFTSRAGCVGSDRFNSPIRRGTGQTFSPNFGGIYGGDLTITATCSGPDHSASTRIFRQEIRGRQPSGSSVRGSLGSPGGPFDAFDLRRIACHESGMRQFSGDPGPALQGPGGDAGIMQMCSSRDADSYWHWSRNVTQGRSVLSGMRNFSQGVPNRVRTRVVRGHGPHPEATNFTQGEWRREAIKRYNAGTSYDCGVWEWDPIQDRWIARPQCAIVSYVDQVLAASHSCR